MSALHTLLADIDGALDTLFYVAAVATLTVVAAWIFAALRFNRRLRAEQKKKDGRA